MSNQLLRAFVDGMLPHGSLWRPAPGLDLDNLLKGVADNMTTAYGVTQQIGQIRDPYFTSDLDDLEREYGITKNTFLSLTQRVNILAARKFSKPSSTIPGIQAQLDLYGFGNGGYGLQVFDNNGGANPNNFVGGVAWVQMGYTTPGLGWMGNTNAFMGISGGGGQLIVNGIQQAVSPNYYCMGLTGITGAGFMGQNASIMGYFATQTYTPVVYTIPTDSGYWGAFLFFGQNPVYAAGTLQTIQNVNVPSARQGELIELITRLKPMWTWAVAMINWI